MDRIEFNNMFLEMAKKEVKEGGNCSLYEDGEVVLDKCLLLGDDEMFEHINNKDYFYQMALDEDGNVYRAYYDLGEFEERYLEEHGREWEHDFGDVDYDHPDFIKKVDENENRFDEVWVTELDMFIDLYKQRVNGSNKMNTAEGEDETIINSEEDKYEDWVEATCILKDNRVLYLQLDSNDNWDCTVYESNGNEIDGGVLTKDNTNNSFNHALKEVGDMLLDIPNINDKIKEIYDHDRREEVFKESLNYQKGIRC